MEPFVTFSDHLTIPEFPYAQPKEILHQKLIESNFFFLEIYVKIQKYLTLLKLVCICYIRIRSSPISSDSPII